VWGWYRYTTTFLRDEIRILRVGEGSYRMATWWIDRWRYDAVCNVIVLRAFGMQMRIYKNKNKTKNDGEERPFMRGGMAYDWDQ